MEILLRELVVVDVPVSLVVALVGDVNVRVLLGAGPVLVVGVAPLGNVEFYLGK